MVRDALDSWLRRARAAKCGPFGGKGPAPRGAGGSDDEEEILDDGEGSEEGAGDGEGMRGGDGGWEEEEEVCGVPVSTNGTHLISCLILLLLACLCMWSSGLM